MRFGVPDPLVVKIRNNGSIAAVITCHQIGVFQHGWGEIEIPILNSSSPRDLLPDHTINVVPGNVLLQFGGVVYRIDQVSLDCMKSLETFPECGVVQDQFFHDMPGQGQRAFRLKNQAVQSSADLENSLRMLALNTSESQHVIEHVADGVTDMPVEVFHERSQLLAAGVGICRCRIFSRPFECDGFSLSVALGRIALYFRQFRAWKTQLCMAKH